MIRPKITFKTDPRGLQNDILRSLPRLNNNKTIERSLRDSSGKLIYKKIEQFKREMVKEFINHPVTKEIMAGSSASNTSGTLNGYGNLYTFIGFGKGDDPITPIINLLNRTTYNFTNFNSRAQFTLNVEMPSADQIFRMTPLPWAPGLSWAQKIEQGMPGFGQYMNKESSTSRSGSGIQADGQIRGGGFRNTKYISALMSKWQNKFKTIGNITNL